MPDDSSPFVSRAGLKLDHALATFRLDVTGLVCADLGCNAGGFTDCLLKRGAAKVYAVDTGYGMLEYKLRRDPRVVVDHDYVLAAAGLLAEEHPEAAHRLLGGLRAVRDR